MTVNGVYKPTYNWGAPSCTRLWSFDFFEIRRHPKNLTHSTAGRSKDASGKITPTSRCLFAENRRVRFSVFFFWGDMLEMIGTTSPICCWARVCRLVGVGCPPAWRCAQRHHLGCMDYAHYARIMMMFPNYPYAPCMEYLPTFALKITQM